MERKMKAGTAFGTWSIIMGIAALLGFGCATMAPEKPKTLIPTDRGTVVFLDKYEFKRPPEDWALMKNLEGGDFELGFMKIEKGNFPSQTTFMYDDQPYGGSRNLEKRAKYYCTRFLFNSGIDLQVTKREKLTIHGRNAMALHMDGKNPNRNEKAKSLVYLVEKGNRIISFVCTQWRPLKGTFNQEPFDQFEAFYENLEEEIRKLKG